MSSSETGRYIIIHYDMDTEDDDKGILTDIRKLFGTEQKDMSTDSCYVFFTHYTVGKAKKEIADWIKKGDVKVQELTVPPYADDDEFFDNSSQE